MITNPVVLITLSPPDAVNVEEEAIYYSAFVAKITKEMGSPVLNLLHGAVGMSGEAGELLDSVKKTWAYNRPVDRVNIVEELGDLRFYMQMVMIQLKISEEEVIQGNVDKLAKRYIGLTYSDIAAQIRADKQSPQVGQGERYEPTNRSR
jgi:NTP pyrophosphatase (non-canonical NTP hydrolase)